MTATKRIIIDTDPGIDDAVAILLALTLRQSSTVEADGRDRRLHCRSPPPRAERAYRSWSSPGGPIFRSTPAAPRGRFPLACLIAAEHFHGESGSGTLVTTRTTCAMALQRAGTGSISRSTCCAAAPPAGVTPVRLLRPLTNVALAIIKAPEIASGVAELVLMGGASRALEQQHAPAAGFNIHADPHAAAIVFGSGLPITMVPLDLTHQVRSTAPRKSPPITCAIGTTVGERRVARIARVRRRQSATAALHDWPCVIAYLAAA